MGALDHPPAARLDRGWHPTSAMCSNGRYTERGIKQVDGFMAERWRIEPDYAVRVDRDLGMLGVLLGAEVHVLDRATSGPKPALVQRLGGTYHTGAISDLGLRPHIVVECTGVVELILQAMATVSPGGIICLTGIGSAPARGTGSAATLANDVVLKNIAVFGSVNANRGAHPRPCTCDS